MMRTFLAALVVLPYDLRVATSWGEIQAYPNSAAVPGRRTIRGSPPAASSGNSRSPRSTSRTTPTSPSTRASNVSYEDTSRGRSRGTNHSRREATTDTGREQKAQVGRTRAPAIPTSTGLRRRERDLGGTVPRPDVHAIKTVSLSNLTLVTALRIAEGMRVSPLHDLRRRPPNEPQQPRRCRVRAARQPCWKGSVQPSSTGTGGGSNAPPLCSKR